MLKKHWDNYNKYFWGQFDFSHVTTNRKINVFYQLATLTPKLSLAFFVTALLDHDLFGSRVSISHMKTCTLHLTLA